MPTNPLTPERLARVRDVVKCIGHNGCERGLDCYKCDLDSCLDAADDPARVREAVMAARERIMAEASDARWAVHIRNGLIMADKYILEVTEILDAPAQPRDGSAGELDRLREALQAIRPIAANMRFRAWATSKKIIWIIDDALVGGKEA